MAPAAKGALMLTVAACAVAGVAALALSRGRARPFLDATGAVVPGSISEKAFVDINGSRQGVFIRGRSTSLPVLLYLHGGIPDYFLTPRHPTGLEEDFIVAWWEQRGAGLSHAAASADAPPTAEQIVGDAIAMAEYLRRRFGQERIYLMGRSGGTYIGMKVIARAPELFHAYIGIAQITAQLESERRAHAYMLERFREAGDARWVRRLEATSLEHGTPRDYLRIRDGAMHTLGIGTMRDMHSIVTGLFVPSLLFGDYTVREKWNLWAAKARYGVSAVWDEILADDLRASVPEVQVPVYFLHGAHDYTCSYELARAYAATLRAPVKGFYTFPDAAHSPHFEDPGRTRRILREDVLRGTTTLADGLPALP